MTLYFNESGTPGAPTVVFLHGLIASGWIWQDTTRRLEGDFHCLVPDLPGHGESRQTGWKSLRETAGQVARLIRAHAKGGKAQLVGAALGGMLALEVLASAPDVAEGVLVSGVNAQPLPLRLRLTGWLLLPMLRSQRFSEVTAAGLHLATEQLPLLQRDLAEISRWTVLRGSLAASGFRLPAELSGAQAPLLALAGEQEGPYALASLRHIRAELPGAQARLVRQARRGWMSEQPELWERILRAWLTRQALPEELADVE